MPVNRHQLMNELELKLSNDHEAQDAFADVGRQVERHWKSLAPKPGQRYAPGKGGYATGAYEASIHRESVRATGSLKGTGNRGGWHTRVLTYSPIAHFLEYGTGPDDAPNYPKPPNSGGHWTDLEGEEHWWWNTPTPAFAFAADAEMSFSSTMSAAPLSRKARSYAAKGTSRGMAGYAKFGGASTGKGRHSPRTEEQKARRKARGG